MAAPSMSGYTAESKLGPVAMNIRFENPAQQIDLEAGEKRNRCLMWSLEHCDFEPEKRFKFKLRFHPVRMAIDEDNASRASHSMAHSFVGLNESERQNLGPQCGRIQGRFPILSLSKPPNLCPLRKSIARSSFRDVPS
jgi:hypothetical protein